MAIKVEPILSYTCESIDEKQWLQIALKTYFWAGVMFALVFSISLLCLAATKYYHDMTVIHIQELDRNYRSYMSDLSDSRQQVREVGKIWYEVEQTRKKIEAKFPEGSLDL